MNHKASITALMSSFGRAFHTENENHPVFTDHLAKELMTSEEYVILGSGLDTFAFREAEFLSKYKVFEVNHPLTQKDKLERIHRAGWMVSDSLSFESEQNYLRSQCELTDNV